MPIHSERETADIDSPYVVGVPVDGTDLFFGRVQETERFYQRILRTPLDPFEVRGLRRSGKTSFLRHVADPERARTYLKENFDSTIIVYVNVQRGIRTPTDFFETVAKSIAASCRDIAIPITPRSFSLYMEFDEWLKSLLSQGIRFVVLLDEFETLGHASECDRHFFDFLRSCMTDSGGQLTFVPSSFRGVGELSKRNGLTSTLSNVYNDSRKITVGALDKPDALALLSDPARVHGVKIANQARKISGNVPFFVQAVADRWFIQKQMGGGKNDLHDTVIDDLLKPGELIDRVLRDYWKTFNARERQYLFDAAQGKHVPSNGVTEDLVNFGLMKSKGSILSLSSELLERWILNQDQQGASHTQHCIFVCYAHVDEDNEDPERRWLTRLLRHLDPLLHGQLKVWSDKEIELGDKWHDQIQENLACSAAAVLLVSGAFLNSSYIRSCELPILLDRHSRNQTKIFPVSISRNVSDQISLNFPDPKLGPHSCRLADFQMLPSLDRTLESLQYDEQEAVFVQLAASLKNCV